MAGGIEALLAEGQTALAAGDWATARSCFVRVLDESDSADAWFGLGIAQWWLAETHAALRSWEQAHVGFRRRPDPDAAVLSAFYLCLSYRMSLGNAAVSRGWMTRAVRLAQEHDLPQAGGWVSLARAYVANEDRHPADAQRWAREALATARASADTDLEVCSAGELGAALVESGLIDDGVALLDEAMARALAGETDLDSVVLVTCRTITSCSRGGEVPRAAQWIRAGDRFHQRHGSPHLFMTCRTHYGSILVATGEWAKAEAELHTALRIGRDGEDALRSEALAALAALRLAQGRLEEARALLDGYEGQAAAVPVLAAAHLVRGEPAAAVTVLRRRLRDVDEACLEAAPLRELLVEAHLAQAEIDAARDVAEALAAHGETTGCPLIVARGERALGRVLLVMGDRSAFGHLEAALAAFVALQMPLEIGRTRQLLAVATEDRATAVAEARTALSLFERLGAERDAAAAAALLRSLGVRAARTGTRRTGALTKREQEVLVLLGEGLSNAELAERLFISRKTVEHHVASVLSKLGLRGRAEAAAYATRHGDRESAAT